MKRLVLLSDASSTHLVLDITRIIAIAYVDSLSIWKVVLQGSPNVELFLNDDEHSSLLAHLIDFEIMAIPKLN